MRTIQRRPSRMPRLIVPAICLSVLGYFALHAQGGRYGLEARAELSRELDVKRVTLDELKTERARLDQRVLLMRDGTLEFDMVDERVRRALNLVRDDEIVIPR